MPDLASPTPQEVGVRRLAVVIAALAVTVVPGIGTAAAGGGNGDPTLQSSPQGKATRGKGYERTIHLAVVDIQDFWSTTFPDVYGGSYEPVPDDRIIAAHPGVRLPRCQGQKVSYADAEGNAFYCYQSNFVVYDDVQLFPQIYRDFGEFSVALVLAHEWGHAVQDRAGNADQLTIYKELQADCFAGAWTRHVSDGESRLEIAGGTLDRALAAMLQFRDVPGSSPDDPSAHGSGFDRVAAFEQGFDDGASQCATYFDSPPVTTEAEFENAEDAATGGNLPAEEVIPSTVDLLNSYYQAVEPSLYQPLTIDDIRTYDGSGPKSRLPKCGGSRLARKDVKNRIFYCLDDGYIAFDEPYLQHVYDDIGDFGVATLLANTWATYVQKLQGFPGVDDNAVNAVFGADCYTGSFSASLFNESLLSSGDLDETVQALIDYASSRGVGTDVDLTFLQLRAFRDGFFNGYAVCGQNYSDPNAVPGQ
jgi:predicted metalloprotease